MSNDELLKLDNQLCFVIYACSRGLTRTYRPLLDNLGITYPQYLVLLSLWEVDKVTVKSLGERLYLDSGTLTPLLKRMETAGLVSRKRSGIDERKVYITLTKKGKALKQKALNVPQTLGSMLCKDPEVVGEIDTLKNGLEVLLRHLHSVNDK